MIAHTRRKLPSRDEFAGCPMRAREAGAIRSLLPIVEAMRIWGRGHINRFGG